MNDTDRTVSGVEDANGLMNLRDAVLESLAREKQRSVDKLKEDELRASLRQADNEWRKSTTERLDRVQEDVHSVRETVAALPTAIDMKLALTAKELKDKITASELLTAQLKRETDARDRSSQSFGVAFKTVATVLLVTCIVITAAIVFTDTDTLAQSILILAEVLVPAIAMLAFVWYRR